MAQANQRQTIWQYPDLKGVELLRADYLKQSFSRHYHEGYAIGVIEKGLLQFNYRHQHYSAGRGEINLAVPGESHDGYSVDGWSYRMFYIRSELLGELTAEVSRKQVMPFFSEGVLRDRDIATQLYSLHLLLEEGGIGLLEAETRLMAVLVALIDKYSDYSLNLWARREKEAVKQVKDYLEANFSQNVSLKELAQVVNVSPYHLTRVFSEEVGLPPHTYLTQVRVNRAKVLLSEMVPLVEVANVTGFADQSHLNRSFKRVVGVTPGQYSKNIQDPVH